MCRQPILRPLCRAALRSALLVARETTGCGRSGVESKQATPVPRITRRRQRHKTRENTAHASATHSQRGKHKTRQDTTTQQNTAQHNTTQQPTVETRRASQTARPNQTGDALEPRTDPAGAGASPRKTDPTDRPAGAPVAGFEPAETKHATRDPPWFVARLFPPASIGLCIASTACQSYRQELQQTPSRCTNGTEFMIVTRCIE